MLHLIGIGGNYPAIVMSQAHLLDISLLKKGYDKYHVFWNSCTPYYAVV